MVEQFSLPVRIVGSEEVQAEDGLALSSRNRYLNADERARATGLSRVLARIRDALAGGETDFAAQESAALAELRDSGWTPDYVSVRRQVGLRAPAAGTARTACPWSCSRPRHSVRPA
jgi:pantoate--beta-alanine ligase